MCPDPQSKDGSQLSGQPAASLKSDRTHDRPQAPAPGSMGQSRPPLRVPLRGVRSPEPAALQTGQQVSPRQDTGGPSSVTCAMVPLEVCSAHGRPRWEPQGGSCVSPAVWLDR